MDIIGILVMFVGVLGFVGIISMDAAIATVISGVGIMLIIQSSIFIHLERTQLNREVEEFERMRAIREEIGSVPDNMEKGYLIDLTAEPEYAVQHGKTEECEYAEDDESIPEDTPDEEEVFCAEFVDDRAGAAEPEPVKETELEVPDREGEDVSDDDLAEDDESEEDMLEDEGEIIEKDDD